MKKFQQLPRKEIMLILISIILQRNIGIHPDLKDFQVKIKMNKNPDQAHMRIKMLSTKKENTSFRNIKTVDVDNSLMIREELYQPEHSVINYFFK